MKRLLIILALMGINGPIFAETPTRESIVELMEITETRKVLDEMISQMGTLIQQVVNEAAAQQGLSAGDDEFQAMMHGVMMDYLKDELNWDRLLSIYIPVYQETFSQKEIDGIIAFYRSDIGRAFVEKQPLLLQRIMARYSSEVGPMMERVQVRINAAVEKYAEANK